ncbi:Uncharacterised protein [Vibrio cholerae]|nr:Uncharacterised protein [Vibrio cholerae]CSI90356.1 Uncharacterised protein [Vibrio cholerae]
MLSRLIIKHRHKLTGAACKSHRMRQRWVNGNTMPSSR